MTFKNKIGNAMLFLGIFSPVILCFFIITGIVSFAPNYFFIVLGFSIVFSFICISIFLSLQKTTPQPLEQNSILVTHYTEPSPIYHKNIQDDFFNVILEPLPAYTKKTQT